jgi:hypothetical protein
MIKRNENAMMMATTIVLQLHVFLVPLYTATAVPLGGLARYERDSARSTC